MLYNGQAQGVFSGYISLLGEKDEVEAGEKKKCPNNDFSRTISLLEDLAISNDQLVAWGSGYRYKITGKPSQWQRPVP